MDTANLCCYICDSKTNANKLKNIADVKTAISKKPMVEYLVKFLRNRDEPIRAHNGSSRCVLCDECIDQINTHDEAYMLVEQVEKELKTKIAATANRYEEIRTLQKNQSEIVDLDAMDDVDDADQADELPFDEMEFDADPTSDMLNTYASDDDFKFDDDDTEDSNDSFVWPRNSDAEKTTTAAAAAAETKKTTPFVYSCTICPANFYDKYEMELHTASHRDPTFRCGICYMRVTKGRDSIEHENLHANCTDFQCIFCNETLANRSELVLHMETHNGDISTICYICGLTLRTVSFEVSHLRAHMGVKDIQCKLCPQKFTTKNYLRKHVLAHHEGKRYTCPDPNCDKSFSSYNNCREHSFIHTENQPNFVRKCSICDKLFRRPKLLAEHYQKTHNILVDVPVFTKSLT